MTNSGTDLWNKAKGLIPGGNQLLSKRPEMFLPDQWPSFYKRAQGCEIWDMEDEHYYDMSIMGIGTSVLGYAHPQVNRAVEKAIENGNMSSLNCYEEVELAQKIIELHPWAEMVRFSRTGGEACSIAIRIARARAGKDKVAFCGYHGWGDWYLASNLADDKNLDGQLLPGLAPAGVPQGLKDSSIPFAYGDLQQFKKIVRENENQLGVVIMEVARYQEVDVHFLNEIRRITRESGIVLIFDEISSGFRIHLGGMHMLYDVQPDMMVLGKAMGNGYAISAIAGTKNVMDAAQLTFISSTYWTERIGFVAALETIKVFDEQNVIEKIVKAGNHIKEQLNRLFEKHSVDICLAGLPTIISLIIKESDPLVFKTVFTQEMLKRGFLASNVIYVSMAHTPEIIQKYLEAVDEVLGVIKEAQSAGTLKAILNGPVCHSGFKRLN